jgi:hypothetical protein
MLVLMIDFEHVWLPQIVGYAKIISTGRLEDQWLGRVGVVTSVTDPDELQEQVFGDLDADAIWIKARESLQSPPSTIDAIDVFLAALHEIDESDAAALLASKVWLKVKDAANVLLANVRS